MKRRVAPYFALLVLLVLLTALGVWAQMPAVRVPPSPLNRGLAAWWIGVPGFTQTDQLYDLMEGHAHCTLVNMASAQWSGWTPSTRSGGFMHLTLDGVNDAVNCGTPVTLTDIRVRSVALWFQLTSWNVNNLSRLVDKRGVGGWTFALNNAGIANGLQWTQDFATSSGNWGLSNVITLGTWVHLGVTYDSTTTAPPIFFVNGVALAPDTTFSSPSGAYSPDAASSLTIGDDPGATVGDRNTAGLFDDIRLWSRQLGTDEMRAVYQQSQRRDLLPGPPLPELATMPEAAAAPGRGQFFPFFH
jgi:hypothetical protein